MGRGEVRFRLVLDSKDFTNGIRAAKNEANQMANELSSKLGRAGNVLSAMGPAGLAAAAGIGALAGAAGIAMKATIDAVSATAKYADAMAALQEKTGLSAKALQEFEVAAKLGNSSIEAVASAVNKMQRGIFEGSDNFRRLGLSIKDLKSMSPEEQFRKVAIAIESISDPAQKAAARFAIFGKSGNELSATLKAAAEGAGQLGGALSEEALKAAADFQDQTDLLNEAWDRVIRQFGAAVARSPELQDAIKDVTNAIVKMAEKIGELAPKISQFFDTIVKGAKLAWAALQAKNLAMGGFVGMGADVLKKGIADFNMPSFGDVVGGGSSSATKPGLFKPPVDKDALAKAERLRAAYQAASEKAREEWDKFFDMMRERSGDMLQDQKKTIAQMAKDHAARVMQELEDIKSIEKAEEEIIKETARRQREEFVNLLASIRDVGMATLELGDLIGGAFGKMLQGLGALVDGFGSVLQNIDRIKQAGGGLGGLLGKIGGGLGIASAAVGVVGFIKGLFGGKSKEEKAAEEAERQQKIKDTMDKMASALERISQIKMEKLQAGVGGLAALFSNLANKAALTPGEIDRVNSKMAKYKEKLKEAGLEEDEYNKKIKQRRHELEHAMGEADVEKMKERMERLGIIGAAMFESLKKEGMSTVEAMKEMGPALDQAIKAAQAHGIEIGGTLGILAQFREKVLANEDLVNAAEGLSSVMDALRSTGGLNATTFGALRDEMNDLFADLQAGGFSASEALALIAPTLLQIRDAARDGRIQVDEATQALIDQAEAGGHFDGLKDPMSELVEVQKMMLELWAAIAHMQGVTLPASLQEYLNTLRQAAGAAQGVGAGVGVGNGGVHGGQSSGIEIDWPEHSGEPGHAAGGLRGILGTGPLSGGGTPLVGHPGEEVYIGPRGGRGHGGVTGGMPAIQLVVDGKVWAQHNNQNMRRNRWGTASETSRRLGR